MPEKFIGCTGGNTPNIVYSTVKFELKFASDRSGFVQPHLKTGMAFGDYSEFPFVTFSYDCEEYRNIKKGENHQYSLNNANHFYSKHFGSRNYAEDSLFKPQMCKEIKLAQCGKTDSKGSLGSYKHKTVADEKDTLKGRK